MGVTYRKVQVRTGNRHDTGGGPYKRRQEETDRFGDVGRSECDV